MYWVEYILFIDNYFSEGDPLLPIFVLFLNEESVMLLCLAELLFSLTFILLAETVRQFLTTLRQLVLQVRITRRFLQRFFNHL